MHAKNVPSEFWAKCLKTAAHITNRLPQAKLGFVSPYQKLWKIKPTVSHFRVFGCVCYVLVPEKLRSKFEKKTIRCIFVGYDTERKGWRCCDPTTHQCYTSHNMVFDEASSWWSRDTAMLPSSGNLEENLQQKLSTEDDKGDTKEEMSSQEP